MYGRRPAEAGAGKSASCRSSCDEPVDNSADQSCAAKYRSYRSRKTSQIADESLSGTGSQDHQKGIKAVRCNPDQRSAGTIERNVPYSGICSTYSHRATSRLYTKRRFAAVRRFGRDRSEADMPRASGAGRSDENDPTETLASSTGRSPGFAPRRSIAAASPPYWQVYRRGALEDATGKRRRPDATPSGMLAT